MTAINKMFEKESENIWKSIRIVRGKKSRCSSERSICDVCDKYLGNFKKICSQGCDKQKHSILNDGSKPRYVHNLIVQPDKCNLPIITIKDVDYKQIVYCTNLVCIADSYR